MSNVEEKETSSDRESRSNACYDGGSSHVNEELKKGQWSPSEDEILVEYVKKNGEGNWNQVHRKTSLKRRGKSCRLRWLNHLKPNPRKGAFSVEEVKLILELHNKYGNKWAHIATKVPGRTDNEIKNFWNTNVKKLQQVDHHQNTSSSSSLPRSHFPNSLQTSNPSPITFHTFTFPSPPSSSFNQNFQGQLPLASSQTKFTGFDFTPSTTMGNFSYPHQTNSRGFDFNTLPTLESSFNQLATNAFSFNPSATPEGFSNLFGSSTNLGSNTTPSLGGSSNSLQTMSIFSQFHTIPRVGSSSEPFQTTSGGFTTSVEGSSNMIKIVPKSLGLSTTPSMGGLTNPFQAMPCYNFGFNTTPSLGKSSNPLQSTLSNFGSPFVGSSSNHIQTNASGFCFLTTTSVGNSTNSFQTKPSGSRFNWDKASNPLQNTYSGFSLDPKPTTEGSFNPLGFAPISHPESDQNESLVMRETTQPSHGHINASYMTETPELDDERELEEVIEKSQALMHFGYQKKETSLKGKDKVIYESNAEFMDVLTQPVADSTLPYSSMGIKEKGPLEDINPLDDDLSFLLDAPNDEDDLALFLEISNASIGQSPNMEVVVEDSPMGLTSPSQLLLDDSMATNNNENEGF